MSPLVKKKKKNSIRDDSEINISTISFVRVMKNNLYDRVYVKEVW